MVFVAAAVRTCSTFRSSSSAYDKSSSAATHLLSSNPTTTLTIGATYADRLAINKHEWAAAVRAITLPKPDRDWRCHVSGAATLLARLRAPLSAPLLAARVNPLHQGSSARGQDSSPATPVGSVQGALSLGLHQRRLQSENQPRRFPI